MKKSAFLAAALSAAALASCTRAFPPVGPELLRSQPLARQLGPSTSIEIDPRVELLSGVLLNSSWTRGHAKRSGQASGYVVELKALLGPERAGGAIRNAEALGRLGFDYDAPPALVLSTTEGLAMRAPDGGYSAYLRKRGLGSANLGNLVSSFRTAAAASSFDGFWESHRPYYDALLDRASAGLEADKVVAWLLSYYGAKGRYRFHYVLAPALFPGGGYGITVDRDEDGVKVRHVYQVVRDAENVDSDGLTALALHEFGHGFVNPAVGDHVPPGARRGLEAIFAPVRPQMREQAYPSVEVFLNELVLRACTIRGQVLLGFLDEAGADAALAGEEAYGFYPIRAVYSLLADYEAGHANDGAGAATYPDFASFAPVLLEKLSAQAKELVATAPRSPAPVLDFATGFEGLATAPGPAFALESGATNSGKGGLGKVFLDGRSPFEGSACLSLSGNVDTTVWRIVKLPLAVKAGRVSVSWAVRGSDLRQEGAQFDNAFVGLILTDKEGKRRFQVRTYSGSFDWTRDSLVLELDPRSIAAAEFCVFLSESGELSVDDLRIERR
jgi:hypothetical protein